VISHAKSHVMSIMPKSKFSSTAQLIRSLLLSYHSSHEATATYILTGPLLRESTLTYTQLPPQTQAEPKATQSLAHMGGQVKIVDDGADDAGALGVKGAEDDHEGELEAEETPRWGVVLVSEEGLEGAYCSTVSCGGRS
jgi:hypothetical protein